MWLGVGSEMRGSLSKIGDTGERIQFEEKSFILEVPGRNEVQMCNGLLIRRIYREKKI